MAAPGLVLPNRLDEAEWRRKLQEADRRNLKLGADIGMALMTIGAGTAMRSLSSRFADMPRPEDFGAVGDGVTDDSQALQDWLDSGYTGLYMDGVYGLANMVTQARNVTVYGGGATLKPTANTQLWRLHGGARLFGKPHFDVTGYSGWNQACVVFDGASEQNAATEFRVGYGTFCDAECVGVTTGSGNGDAFLFTTADDLVNNSWIMGVAVAGTVLGFDNACHIVRAGTDPLRTFVNFNTVHIMQTYSLRSLYMDSPDEMNINSNTIWIDGQSRPSAGQTATPLACNSDNNTLILRQVDWVGGGAGTLYMLTLGSVSTGNLIYLPTPVSAAFIQNNSASRTNTIINPASGEGWLLGDVSSVISGSNIRFWDPVRFENGVTLGIGFRDAAGTSEWQAVYADSSDNLTLRSGVTAAARAIVNANNTTGRVDLRVNNTNKAHVDATGLVLDTVLVGSEETLTGAGAVSIATHITKVATTGANALTLAAGTNGQEKIIVMTTDGGDGTLTPTNFGNGTTITFADVGDSVKLVYSGSKWWVLSNNGCVVA